MLFRFVNEPLSAQRGLIKRKINKKSQLNGLITVIFIKLILVNCCQQVFLFNYAISQIDSDQLQYDASSKLVEYPQDAIIQQQQQFALNNASLHASDGPRLHNDPVESIAEQNSELLEESEANLRPPTTSQLISISRFDPINPLATFNSTLNNDNKISDWSQWKSPSQSRSRVGQLYNYINSHQQQIQQPLAITTTPLLTKSIANQSLHKTSLASNDQLTKDSNRLYNNDTHLQTSSIDQFAYNNDDKFRVNISNICERDGMQIAININKPFHGLIHAKDKRKKPACYVEGNGNLQYNLRISYSQVNSDANYCGVLAHYQQTSLSSSSPLVNSSKLQQEQVQFNMANGTLASNSTSTQQAQILSLVIVVRLHKTIESSDDRFFLLSCSNKCAWSNDCATSLGLAPQHDVRINANDRYLNNKTNSIVIPKPTSSPSKLFNTATTNGHQQHEKPSLLIKKVSSSNGVSSHLMTSDSSVIPRFRLFPEPTGLAIGSANQLAITGTASVRALQNQALNSESTNQDHSNLNLHHHQWPLTTSSRSSPIIVANNNEQNLVQNSCDLQLELKFQWLARVCIILCLLCISMFTIATFLWFSLKRQRGQARINTKTTGFNITNHDDHNSSHKINNNNIQDKTTNLRDKVNIKLQNHRQYQNQTEDFLMRNNSGINGNIAGNWPNDEQPNNGLNFHQQPPYIVINSTSNNNQDQQIQPIDQINFRNANNKSNNNNELSQTHQQGQRLLETFHGPQQHMQIGSQTLSRLNGHGSDSSSGMNSLIKRRRSIGASMRAEIIASENALMSNMHQNRKYHQAQAPIRGRGNFLSTNHITDHNSLPSRDNSRARSLIQVHDQLKQEHPFVHNKLDYIEDSYFSEANQVNKTDKIQSNFERYHNAGQKNHTIERSSYEERKFPPKPGPKPNHDQQQIRRNLMQQQFVPKLTTFTDQIDDSRYSFIKNEPNFEPIKINGSDELQQPLTVQFAQIPTEWTSNDDNSMYNQRIQNELTNRSKAIMPNVHSDRAISQFDPQDSRQLIDLIKQKHYDQTFQAAYIKTDIAQQ